MRSVLCYMLQLAVAFVVSMGTTVGLAELAGASEEIAFAAGLVAASCSNFALLRYVTFPSRSAPILPQLVRYVASIGLFRAAEYALFLLFHTALGLDYRPVALTILAVSCVAKFAVYRLIFRAASAPVVAEPAEPLRRAA